MNFSPSGFPLNSPSPSVGPMSSNLQNVASPVNLNIQKTPMSVSMDSASNRIHIEKLRQKYGYDLFQKDSYGRFTCFFKGCLAKLTSNFARHLSRHEVEGRELDLELIESIRKQRLNGPESPLSPAIPSPTTYRLQGLNSPISKHPINGHYNFLPTPTKSVQNVHYEPSVLSQSSPTISFKHYEAPVNNAKPQPVPAKKVQKQYVPEFEVTTPPLPPPPYPRCVVQPPAKKSKQLTFQDCEEILEILFKNKHVWPFWEPINPQKLGLSDYFKAIAQPMDLSTIKGKLKKGNYINTNEFIEDVKLIWKNAQYYFKKNSPVFDCAEELSKEFDKQLKNIQKGFSLQYPTEELGEESDYCGVCGDAGELLICDGECLQAFHLKCVGLVNEPTTLKWYCQECLKKQYYRFKISKKPIDFKSNPNTETKDTFKYFPNYSTTPPINPPSQFQPPISRGKITFSSEALEKEKREKRNSISHLEKGMSKQRKILRHQIDMKLKDSQMYFCPFWCMWRPKVKKSYCETLKKVLPKENQNDDDLICSICGTSENQSNFVLCDECNQEYHLQCLPQTVVAPDSKRWLCIQCTEKEKQKTLSTVSNSC